MVKIIFNNAGVQGENSLNDLIKGIDNLYKLIVDKKVSKEPLTRQLCEQFNDVQKIVVENYEWHKEETAVDPYLNPLTMGKKILHTVNFVGALKL